MSRGFVEVGLGTGCVFPVPLRTVVEGVPGFADAVEGGALDGDAEAADVAADGAVEGIADVVVESAADGTTRSAEELAAAVIDVVIDVVVIAGATGAFLSSVAITPNVTPTPASVAIAAVTSATPMGLPPGAFDDDDDDARTRSPLGRLPPSCVAALTPLPSSGIEGRDERTGDPPSIIVASSAFTTGFATGSATGSSGTRARSSGATSCSAASMASADAKRFARSRASARATNAEIGAGTDGSMARTSGASRMQIDRMTCS
jgi:hypothetical protein